MTARVVVLVSGTGTNLQALLDAGSDPSYGVEVVAVGADRFGTVAIERARAAGIDVFELPVESFTDRESWDAELTKQVDAYDPELVVSAGFMKLTGPVFLERFGGRFVNTHPSLLPAFPGMHGPRDALEHGVKFTGATLFIVDAGVDSGPIVAQAVVPVEADDTVGALHERIKQAERSMLVEVVGRMLREGFTITGRRVTIP
jgi:phosphoribosylglycinamide formyltransferase 1